MALSQSTKRLEPTESLEQRLCAHQEEVAQLREEFGDPQLALFAFTRDRLDRKSLLQESYPNGDWQVTDRDDDDELDVW